MKLPAECRYATKPPSGRSVIMETEDGEILCCRVAMRFLAGCDGETPLCRDPGNEVYRITYDHAFGEQAWVRVSRQEGSITVHRVYHSQRFNIGERFEAALPIGDWRRLQDALITANFWSLPPLVSSQGAWLDGYNVIVEGRRGNVFRATTLINPDVDELWQICRVAFDLAGLVDLGL